MTGAGSMLDDLSAFEREARIGSFLSTDWPEGVRAFVDKRRPKLIGG